jgi:hypothetical protein
MISDTLLKSAKEIRNYLKNPNTGRAYTGETRKRIEKLLTEMDAIRMLPGLDTPPHRIPDEVPENAIGLNPAAPAPIHSTDPFITEQAKRLEIPVARVQEMFVGGIKSGKSETAIRSEIESYTWEQFHRLEHKA